VGLDLQTWLDIARHFQLRLNGRRKVGHNQTEVM
jgi:hypothetical protein